MGRFINGQHISWTSELGPNERFGVEDDMSFYELAMKLEENQNKSNFKDSKIIENNNIEPELDFILNKLLIELKKYSESRENAINIIKNIIQNYSNIDYTANNELSTLIADNIPVQKLINYYTEKYKKEN